MFENDGSKAQEHIRLALQELRETRPCAYVRLYDTKSAGGRMLPENPGDFIATISGTSILIEVKSSVKWETLAGVHLYSYVRKSQVTGARVWSRAGAASVFTFEHLPSGRIELWDGDDIVAAVRSRVKLDMKPTLVTHRKELAEVFWQLFSAF